MNDDLNNLYADAVKNKLRAVGDFGTGLGETALTLGSGALAQIPAGLAGVGDFLLNPEATRNPKHALERAAQRVEDTADYWTYSPRSDIGQRAVENVGEGIHAVTEPLARYTVDPIGERSPVAGAALLAAANVLPGPKGTKGATRAAEAVAERLRKPRFDPGSPQQLIPGVEPLSLDEAHARALRDYQAAHQGMTFEDMNRGLRFEYDPDWRGSQLGASELQPGAWDVGYIEPGEVHGKRQVHNIRGSRVFRRALEQEGADPMAEGGDFIHGATPRAEVGAENFQQMLERLERLRAAESEAHTRGGEAMMTRARDLDAQINRRRALLEDPSINDEQRLTLNEEILRLSRQRPINMSGHIVEPTLTEPGMFSPLQWRDALGNEATPEARAYLRDRPGYLDIQKSIVRRLRGEPEPPPVRRARTPESDREVALQEIEGRDPNAMSREAVNAFLTEARANPELFQYGGEPPANVRSLEDFARHFGEKGDMDIGVDMSYGDSDEPSKFKTEKTHGRGEMMRDRYGEYKLAEAEEGQIKYDDRGNPVTKDKEVEVPGPPEKGEGPLTITKEIEKTVPEGDAYMDEDGNYVYRKSEGGEPMRDERGRVKEQWEDNPDYSGSEYDVATISSPHGEITVNYEDPASITATSAGKKGGALLYQVALAHAAREGIEVGGGSLTDINSYRLLGNTLSNLARMGKNPRDVSGTSAGLAQRARGYAEGPEVWRADAEEARHRLLERGTDPDRVRFDPEHGYSVDGQPATPDDIKMKIGDLSPRAGSRGHGGGVGQKSLMRNAVFEWLRNATPEEAQKVAAKWPKEWGPIFAGVGAATVLGGALQEEPQAAD